LAREWRTYIVDFRVSVRRKWLWQVLAEVVGKLRNPADVLAVALVSKRMRQTVGDSLLRLRIEKHHLGADHSFLKPPNAFFSGEPSTVR
jgi:hypothetical protein